MTTATSTAMKPELEYFFGEIVKGFCGKCERCMFLAKRHATKDDLKKEIKTCRWCGTEIDWN